jgi:hypothetical protein
MRSQVPDGHKTPRGAAGAAGGQSAALGKHAGSTNTDAPSQAGGGPEPGATHAGGMGMDSGGDLQQIVPPWENALRRRSRKSVIILKRAGYFQSILRK